MIDFPRASKGETLNVDLWYPSDEKPSHIVINVMSVRAAENLRVSFSHARNGYVLDISYYDDVTELDQWREVAFVDSELQPEVKALTARCAR